MPAESEIESAIQLAFTFCNVILQKQKDSLRPRDRAGLPVCGVNCGEHFGWSNFVHWNVWCGILVSESASARI
jgi:hypothetical protein